jgi:hypothetical protein
MVASYREELRRSALNRVTGMPFGWSLPLAPPAAPEQLDLAALGFGRPQPATASRSA